MKNIWTFIAFISIISFSYGQSFNGFQDQKIQFGVNGFGYGTGITGSYEYGINEWLAIGAGADVYWNNHDNNFFIYGKANFYILNDLLDIPENMDFYPGVNIGGKQNGFGIDGFLGYRYFLNDQWAVFAELGSHGAIGLTLKL